ncbi:MAG: hypothetical protein BGO98_41125 [Myxococcales bacterium 68-20]|nr:hypothetical protein [Myxococcales bacterium]OJY27669.1 MAG: hypothetical protein BGO98_41125 [Myxococcales bacterium 68-20]
MQNIELTKNEHEGVAAGGSAVEALAGLAAVVLSILGLAGNAIRPFAAVATIAVGVALLFEAATVASRVHGRYTRAERTLAKSSIGADSIAAVAAIALGVLSLLRIEAPTLLPVAAIVVGVGLLLSSRAPTVEPEAGGGMTSRGLMAASAVHFLVGLGALVLGIIGVLGNTPIFMTLIAMLSVGGALLVSGAAIGARTLSAIRH